MMKKYCLLAGLLSFFLTLQVRSEAINNGSWRFELQTQKAKIPFIITLTQSQDKLQGQLFNGKETIPLNDIVHRGNSISIPLDPYEISLELRKESASKLTGHLVKHSKSPKVQIPVSGKFGQGERFPGPKKTPVIQLTGNWAVKLVHTANHKEPGVIVFKQVGNKLTGSILTTAGDYRYLEGYVSGNEFQAASFDGVYNYLLKGEVNSGQLKAEILGHSKTMVEGKLDAQASLPDAYKQTQLNALKFSFPNLKGEQVSLNDPQFKNKPVIIQFFGSWCPNCIDEMNYLVPWYSSNKSRGIEVIALSFERSLNEMEAKKQLSKIQKRYNVPYPLLLAGSTSADKPTEKIPGLKNFMSFPTTVFLNKAHQVVKVHAGFTGPSTGEFYEKWKSEFNQTVNELLK
jgi:thiol-disulfide isomerase/thioredoxin